MKKNTLYITALVVFVAVIGIVIFKYNAKENKDKTTEYRLQPRQGATASTDEWKNTQLRAAKLLRSIEANAGDTKSLVTLAGLYVQEARITGNYAYYDKAAMKYVNDALAKDSANFEAMVLKSVIYLSQHHFADGLATAEKVRDINPYSSFVYGLLVDGNVEMGAYDSAVQNAEKMINIRPDMRSYSRVSYLREIHGDYPGAIEAMKMAVEAGPPGEEGTEWARIQLGHLYENSGDLLTAELQYNTSLAARPDYAYALAGLARVSTAKKDYNKAIALYTQADASINDYAIKEGLAEVYKLAGQKDKADALQQKVITEMTADAQSGQTDENIGHYVDRELAYAYLNVNENDKALEHALLEYNRRPANIDVNEALAWVYYNKGEYDKALPYIKTALKTNSKNPTLLCRAGLIYAKTGDKLSAKTNLQEAFKKNGNVAENLRSESWTLLQTL